MKTFFNFNRNIGNIKLEINVKENGDFEYCYKTDLPVDSMLDILKAMISNIEKHS